MGIVGMTFMNLRCFFFFLSGVLHTYAALQVPTRRSESKAIRQPVGTADAKPSQTSSQFNPKDEIQTRRLPRQAKDRTTVNNRDNAFIAIVSLT